MNEIIQNLIESKEKNMLALIDEWRCEGTDTKNYHKLYAAVVDVLLIDNPKLIRDNVEMDLGGFLDELD